MAAAWVQIQDSKSATVIFDDLRAIQGRHGYLPAAELHELSQQTGTPLYQIHSLASFYPHFRLTPPPKADVRVCMDMSCNLNGACELRAALERRYGSLGASEVLVREVSCLGRCDQAPAVTVNDQIFPGMTEATVDLLITRALAGEAITEPEIPHTHVTCNSDPYTPEKRYGALRWLCKSRDVDGVLASLKAADLRGMGGAGFSTEMKWGLVRRMENPEKYIVCNADESEPGTIKDRFIIQHLAHLVAEGMAIAGICTGAKKGIFYIRHEYGHQEHIMKKEVERGYKEGLFGKGILGSDIDFDLEVFVSPGGYICGEESALIEAIEGHRSEPRNKPPFPGQAGLWQKPTVINNVETFANVPQILVRGVDWFKSAGLSGTSGLKFVGISGHVVRPGVYEIPMATPASDVIFKLAGGIRGGKKMKGFAPSGPSSGYLPASMADIKLDFKTLAAAGSMLGSGAMVICDEDTCMLDMALNAVAFFRNESCGKCVPCRVGSQKMVALLQRWTQGGLSERQYAADRVMLDELSNAMTLASICGLGQIVPAPIGSVMKYWPEEVEAHALRSECPSGICHSPGGPARRGPSQRVGINP
ncbi:MAG TPA: NAD(P)H-dependent oxidoreductase subunit E [Candidatus Acidoferrales bacterium]|nr:NAD(P)H-dependent oxidoreductase subunit E [Candidatus Acidoferrales bacterium]